jgi:hypothetical protein
MSLDALLSGTICDITAVEVEAVLAQNEIEPEIGSRVKIGMRVFVDPNGTYRRRYGAAAKISNLFIDLEF